MTFEDDISECALQPAKAPEVIGAEAACHKEKLICPEERQVCYEFEEDMLVPDVKPDIKEIFNGRVLRHCAGGGKNLAGNRQSFKYYRNGAPDLYGSENRGNDRWPSLRRSHTNISGIWIPRNRSRGF